MIRRVWERSCTKIRLEMELGKWKIPIYVDIKVSCCWVWKNIGVCLKALCSNWIQNFERFRGHLPLTYFTTLTTLLKNFLDYISIVQVTSHSFGRLWQLRTSIFLFFLLLPTSLTISFLLLSVICGIFLFKETKPRSRTK